LQQPQEEKKEDAARASGIEELKFSLRWLPERKGEDP